MKALPDSNPRFPGFPWSKLLERGLWAFSLICLSVFLWMKADAWRFQREAEASWDEAMVAKAVASMEAEGTRSASERSAAEASTPAKPGAPIGRLTIPRLDLEVVVSEGTSSSVLQKAVGHLEGTARPGDDGNVVLAGHRDTFFRPLESIRIGDRIELDAGSGKRAYVVEWTKIVAPDRIEVAAPTKEAALTLITCYPFRYIGSAPERFIVRARALTDTAEQGAIGPVEAPDAAG